MYIRTPNESYIRETKVTVYTPHPLNRALAVLCYVANILYSAFLLIMTIYAAYELADKLLIDDVGWSYYFYHSVQGHKVSNAEEEFVWEFALQIYPLLNALIPVVVSFCIWGPSIQQSDTEYVEYVK